MSLIDKCSKIELILSDVDGVMTDGGVIVDHVGNESIQFHIHDGQGIRIWQSQGKSFGIVTGRKLQAVATRANKLDIKILHQGVGSKLDVVEEILTKHKFDFSQVCFIGDDLPDLPVLKRVGLGVAVADAMQELRTSADYVTSIRGGRGAVREVIELIMQNNECWNSAIKLFTD